MSKIEDGEEDNMIIQRLFSDKDFSIKDRLRNSGIGAGTGAILGAGLGILGGHKGDITAGATIGAAIGGGLGLLARKSNPINTDKNKGAIDYLYTPDINRKVSVLPREYNKLSNLNDSKLKSLMPDRGGDEFIYIDIVKDVDIRKQIYSGNSEIIIFRVYKFGPADVTFNFNNNKIKLVWRNGSITFDRGANSFKNYIISEIDKDNKELRKYIELGEDFEDILNFQEYYKSVLNRVL